MTLHGPEHSGEKVTFPGRDHPSVGSASLGRNIVTAPELGMARLPCPLPDQVNNRKILEYIWHTLSDKYTYEL